MPSSSDAPVKRVANDGELYTEEEFLHYYGKTEGRKHWNWASVVGTPQAMQQQCMIQQNYDYKDQVCYEQGEGAKPPAMKQRQWVEQFLPWLQMHALRDPTRNGIYGASIKGNLRHRIEKLGLDVEPEDRTTDQQRLYEIAIRSPTNDQLIRSPISNEVQPGRPLWAGGAFIYMDKRTATALHLLKTLGENGEIPGGVGHLCSKYVFCDKADFELVLSVLNAPSEAVNYSCLLYTSPSPRD